MRENISDMARRSVLAQRIKRELEEPAGATQVMQSVLDAAEEWYASYIDGEESSFERTRRGEIVTRLAECLQRVSEID
jgi:hypothetical protein